MNKENILTIALIITSVFLGFAINELYDIHKTNELLQLESSKQDIIEYSQCRNLSLQETSECLRKYISTFYNYTIKKDKIRTIEDIKLNGGDCYDYNMLYDRLGEELGFDTFNFRIGIGDGTHRIAIISDDTGYCLLDQLHKPECVMGKNNEM